MKTRPIGTGLFLWVTITCSCTRQPRIDEFWTFVAEHKDYVFLGMVDTSFKNDEEHQASHPASLQYLAQGIDYFIGAGSIIYELWVEPQRQDEAAKILGEHHIDTSLPPRITLQDYLDSGDFHIELHQRWRLGDRTVGTKVIHEG